MLLGQSFIGLLCTFVAGDYGPNLKSAAVRETGFAARLAHCNFLGRPAPAVNLRVSDHAAFAHAGSLAFCDVVMSKAKTQKRYDPDHHFEMIEKPRGN